jgi:alanyl-tRNA synthetase
MRNHTATHILMGATRRVLGEHAWQAGAQKGTEKSRLDISHFRRLTLDEIQEIELLSNQMVLLNKPIDVLWMPREEAEKKYGFRLYQGGVVLGRDIRIVKTEDWEVEACGGTHLNSTGEVGLIKILNTERIQDGVERIVFSTGFSALKAIQNRENALQGTSKILQVSTEQVETAAERLFIELKETRRDKEKLMRRIAEFTAKDLLNDYSEISGIKLITRILEEENSDQMVKIADIIVTSDPQVIVCLFLIKKTINFVVMVGKDATKLNIRANKIASTLGSILGGGGSGDSVFAQGGGPLKDNLSKAIQKAEEMIIKQKGGNDGIS